MSTKYSRSAICAVIPTSASTGIATSVGGTLVPQNGPGTNNSLHIRGAGESPHIRRVSPRGRERIFVEGMLPGEDLEPQAASESGEVDCRRVGSWHGTRMIFRDSNWDYYSVDDSTPFSIMWW